MKKAMSSTGGRSSTKQSTSKGSPKKKTTNILEQETVNPNKSIRREEVKQLEQFVKKRSQELDHEILTLRDKLKTTSAQGTKAFDTTKPVLDRSYKTKAFVGSYENDSLNHLVGGTALKVRGSGMNKVDLDPQQLMEESRQHSNELATQSKKYEHELEHLNQTRQGTTSAQEQKDHLVSFLAKLRLKMEDADLSPSELQEQLLSRDLAIDGETWIPIAEVTEVLQVDLFYPLTRQDQILLLEEYGNQKKEIDVRMMLEDAGLWVDSTDYPSSPQRGPGSPDVGRFLRTSEEEDGMLSPLQRRAARGVNTTGLGLTADGSTFSKGRPLSHNKDITTRAQKSELDQLEVFRQTDSTLHELKEMHDLILDERDYDDPSLDPSKKTAFDDDLQMHKLSSRNAQKQDTFAASSSSSATKAATGIAVVSDSPRDARKTKKAVDEELTAADLTDDKVRKLAEENQKLRRELGQFDKNFFEELEDLKFRYTKLQEVVGEDPAVDKRLQDDPRMKRLSAHAGKDGLPLTELAWSVRDSMRAMDRAGLDSPLVAGPRISSAHTYAPGKRSGYGASTDRDALFKQSAGRQHLGGSISTTKQNWHNHLEDSIFTGDSALYLPPPVQEGNARSLLRSSQIDGERVVLDGGMHGIGAGKYAADLSLGNSFSNLCERRLAFELTSHPRPTDVTNALIHKVVDVAEKNRITAKDPSANGGRTFITVSQLVNVITGLGLQLAPTEVEVLATGFASDGAGGIDSQEFCDMVHALVYNILGSHADELQRRKPSSQSSGSSRLAASYRSQRGGEVVEEEKDGYAEGRTRDHLALLHEICDGIMNFDRKAVLGASENIFQTLLKAFVEVDLAGSGFVSFRDMCEVLRDMGAMLSHAEFVLLATPYALSPTVKVKASSYPSSNLNHLQSFREVQLGGMLSGQQKLKPRFGEFLTQHGVLDEQDEQEEADFMIEEDTRIKYVELVRDLADILEALIERRGGLPLNPRLDWTLKEFLFVDILISQLEAMTATARRKTLLTLQYAFENADGEKQGELDGFAILTALINAGFRLQRYHRVELLKAAEEYGGRLEYARLILTLLQTAVDWTQSERKIVTKLLKAMGVSVSDRRAWLARLKKALMERAAQTKLKVKAKHQSAMHSPAKKGFHNTKNSNASSPVGRTRKAKNLTAFPEQFGAADFEELPAEDNAFSMPEDEERNAMHRGIPPATFLHVLREMNVVLTPEEEAALLDCLDTERVAKMQAQKLLEKTGEAPPRGIHDRLWSSEGNVSQTTFSMPMIDYDALIQFCSRHCGSWMDASPDLYEAINASFRQLHQPLHALQEYLALLQSFDEKKRGFISYRAFLICSHRSRLLSYVAEADLLKLANNLCIDGAGEIDYTTLVLQFRGMCSALSMPSNSVTVSDHSLSLLQQLVRNGSDQAGNLSILRNYLTLHSDTVHCVMTVKQFNGMLREFSVIYRPEDLDSLLLDLSAVVLPDTTVEEDDHANEDFYKGSAMQARNRRGRQDQVQQRVIDIRKLMAVLMKARDPWTRRNPGLVRYLLKQLKQLQDQQNEHSSVETGGKKWSLENVLVDKILNRLHIFCPNIDADSVAMEGQDASDSAKTAKTLPRMVECGIFDYLLKCMGIKLSHDDLLFLADASDANPEADRISTHLLLDILPIYQELMMGRQAAVNPALGTLAGDADEHFVAGDEGDDEEALHQSVMSLSLTHAAKYVLDHLQSMLWKSYEATMSKLRTKPEFIADVKCLFQGFDVLGKGIMTLDDFMLALQLLNVKVSVDLLADLPFLSDTSVGSGGSAHSIPVYVYYRKVLTYALHPSTNVNQNTAFEDELTESQQLEHLGGSGKLGDSKRLHVTAGGKALKDTSPVAALLRVVRKRICQFILTNKHLEDAWLEMLQVFSRFDKDETNFVTARDFCLAVSVLLEDDDMVLTKAQWEEIIDYFVDKSQHGNNSTSKGRSKGKELLIDYMLFCEMVLDPKEVDKKLQDLQAAARFNHAASSSSGSNSQQALDRSKSKLSTSTRMSMREKENKAMANTAAFTRKPSEESFHGEVVGSSGRWNNNTTIPRSLADTANATTSKVSPSKDPIAQRFQQANAKYQAAFKQGRDYGDSSRVRSKDDHDGYRVATTVGQASRDAAQHKPRPLSATIATSRPAPHGTSSSMSQRASYQSSHPNRNMSAKDAKVRFNWTTTD